MHHHRAATLQRQAAHSHCKKESQNVTRVIICIIIGPPRKRKSCIIHAPYLNLRATGSVHHRPCLQVTFSIIIIRVRTKPPGDSKCLRNACSSQHQRRDAHGNNHRRAALARSSPVPQPCLNCTICNTNTITSTRTQQQQQAPV